MVNCLVQLIGACSNCARVAYNSQFAESKLDRLTGGFCGILLNCLITAGSGGTAPLRDIAMLQSYYFMKDSFTIILLIHHYQLVINCQCACARRL